MTLFINREKDEITIKIKDDDKYREYDYIEMIDFIYKEGAEKVSIEFSDNIEEEEKDSIVKMFDDIQKEINNNNIKKKEQ